MKSLSDSFCVASGYISISCLPDSCSPVPQGYAKRTKFTCRIQCIICLYRNSYSMGASLGVSQSRSGFSTPVFLALGGTFEVDSKSRFGRPYVHKHRAFEIGVDIEVIILKSSLYSEESLLDFIYLARTYMPYLSAFYPPTHSQVRLVMRTPCKKGC